MAAKSITYGFTLILLLQIHHGHPIMYPKESSYREIKDISGRWKFKIDNSTTRNEGFNQKWWEKSLVSTGNVIDMPVPASYNDITQDNNIKNFVGWAWYETEFIVPRSWQGKRIWLQFGSVHYFAQAWINGYNVTQHEGGHLPFEAEVTAMVFYGGKSRLTVAVNNTLTPTTIPPGKISYDYDPKQYPDGYFTQYYQFDFFNYAGIHRPVKLYTTSKVYIQDVTITTACSSDFSQCEVAYSIKTSGPCNVSVDLVHKKSGAMVAKSNNAAKNGSIIVKDPALWWPIGMGKPVGELYLLGIEISVDGVEVCDGYIQQFGIRVVSIHNNKFLINGLPFYFFGVGKHEDWDIRGKGFDWSMVLKDFNMLDWIGANSFRTSHYPYAEEIMELCDERGIVVIDEAPAVGMREANNFVPKTLQHHLDVVGELIMRDKNHPSVVMWSVANEPSSNLPVSENYFKTVFQRVRDLDKTRPVTFVCNEAPDKDLATAFVDVVSVNKYVSWYEDCGHTEVIQKKLGYFLSQWYEKRQKPVIHMEWGAGTIDGFHSDPSVMFTEEYQAVVMHEHFETFDKYRKSFLVGEMIWNFADFATGQAVNRVAGNKKGVLTRQRQPKSAAKVIKERYHGLRK